MKGQRHAGVQVQRGRQQEDGLERLPQQPSEQGGHAALDFLRVLNEPRNQVGDVLVEEVHRQAEDLRVQLPSQVHDPAEHRDGGEVLRDEPGNVAQQSQHHDRAQHVHQGRDTVLTTVLAGHHGSSPQQGPALRRNGSQADGNGSRARVLASGPGRRQHVKRYLVACPGECFDELKPAEGPPVHAGDAVETLHIVLSENRMVAQRYDLDARLDVAADLRVGRRICLGRRTAGWDAGRYSPIG